MNYCIVHLPQLACDLANVTNADDREFVSLDAVLGFWANDTELVLRACRNFKAEKPTPYAQGSNDAHATIDCIRQPHMIQHHPRLQRAKAFYNDGKIFDAAGAPRVQVSIDGVDFGIINALHAVALIDRGV